MTSNEDRDPIGNGLLGDDASQAVQALKQALAEHALPFLQDWWEPDGPIPSEEEIGKLRAAVEERKKLLPLDPAYGELPELLKRLADGMRFNRRNYVNIHPSPFAPAVTAGLVTALQNPNNIVEEVSKATTAMEREAVVWMAENLLGLPKPADEQTGYWGNLVSGGTLANITALLVARDYTYDKLSRPRPARVGARGVGGLKPGVVIGTKASHYSIDKALWLLGLGSENLVRVPVGYDEELRSRRFKDERFLKGLPTEWRELIGEALAEDKRRGERELASFYAGEHAPFGLQPLGSEIYKAIYSCFTFDVPLIAAVLTLGTTDTGTIERIDAQAVDRLKQEDVFLHVDAASGGFFFGHDDVRQRLNKLDQVDSFTLDPHKTGLMHYPCGAVIFRDAGFREQIYHEAPYLGPLAPTIEGSRPGGPSAGLWLALRTIGPEGYRQVAERLFGFVARLENALRTGGKFQVLHERHTNALAVAPLRQGGETRRDLNRLVRAVRERVVAERKFLVNLDRHLSAVKVFDTPPTRENPTPSEPLDIEALRIVVTNPLVRPEDAQVLADELVRYLDEERGKGAGFVAAAVPAAPPESHRGGFSEEP
jgi:glutamate/tyrosine decarboxylase-like PLP-dependent enzyme